MTTTCYGLCAHTYIQYEVDKIKRSEGNTMKDQSYLKAFTSKFTRGKKECKRLANAMRCNEVSFSPFCLFLLYSFSLMIFNEASC